MYYCLFILLDVNSTKLYVFLDRPWGFPSRCKPVVIGTQLYFPCWSLSSPDVRSLHCTSYMKDLLLIKQMTGAVLWKMIIADLMSIKSLIFSSEYLVHAITYAKTPSQISWILHASDLRDYLVIAIRLPVRLMDRPPTSDCRDQFSVFGPWIVYIPPKLDKHWLRNLWCFEISTAV